MDTHNYFKKILIVFKDKTMIVMLEIVLKILCLLKTYFYSKLILVGPLIFTPLIDEETTFFKVDFKLYRYCRL